LLGSPGESVYSASNAAADAIAVLRRQAGLTCTSLQWGTWTGIGFADGTFNAELSKAGFNPIDESQGTKIVTAILNNLSILPPVLGCIPIKWSTFLSSGPLYIKTYMSCLDAVKAKNSGSATPESIPQQTDDMIKYAQLETVGGRKEHLVAILTKSIHDISGLMVFKDDNLQEAGLTSLQAIQLLQSLTNRFPIKIKVCMYSECVS